MTYDEWISLGVLQGYCTRAACLVHELDELLSFLEGEQFERMFEDGTFCVPGVVLVVPAEQEMGE